jgi:hypothetical protein
MPALQTDAATVSRRMVRELLVAQPNLPALCSEPVLAADFVATQRGFVLAVLTEVAVAVELGLKLTRDKLGHERIVEEAKPGILSGIMSFATAK